MLGSIVPGPRPQIQAQVRRSSKQGRKTKQQIGGRISSRGQGLAQANDQAVHKLNDGPSRDGVVAVRKTARRKVSSGGSFAADRENDVYTLSGNW